MDASSYVYTEIPTNRTRVAPLLDSIDCADPFLLAHLANIKASPALQVDFESSVTLMLPSDPVAKKKGKTEANRQAEISSASIQFKKGIGETGVELRNHPPAEYALLSDDKRAELGV